MFSKCELLESDAYLDLGQNCFIVRFFIPLLLANIPMKLLETYTISSELIWNCHKHTTISVQLLFNHICASCTFYDKDRNRRVTSFSGEETETCLRLTLLKSTWLKKILSSIKSNQTIVLTWAATSVGEGGQVGWQTFAIQLPWTLFHQMLQPITNSIVINKQLIVYSISTFL